MEPRDKHRTRKVSRGLKKNAVEKHFDRSPLHLPNIAELIEDGEITVGILRPIGCVATASDESSTLAMLVRQEGETLFQLLARLDLAIAKAQIEDIFTDEINPPNS